MIEHMALAIFVLIVLVCAVLGYAIWSEEDRQ